MFKKSKKKQSLGRIGRVEREQRYNRMVRYATIGVVTLVLVIALGGILYNSVYLPSRPIVTVNGDEILTRDFQTRVEMDRARLVNQYNSYLEVAQQITDPNQQQQYLLLLSQIEAQLDPDTIGQSTINQMIDEKFIVEEAQSRGITVSDEEVDTFLDSIFGYYPNGIPTDFPVPTSLPTSTLSPTQLALITPTPQAEEGEGDEADAPAVLPEQPEPTSVTEEEFDTSLSDYLDNMKEFGVDEAYLRELIRTQLYRDKLNAELAKGITPPMEEQVWARHILVEDLETAEDILQQLEDGGDFGDLAAEYGTDGTAAFGGDLGWFGRGQMITEFEDAAFGGEIGEIVGPVETQFGFHLIQIIGKEERPAPASQLDNLVLVALTDILNQDKEEADIVFAENYLSRTPTKPDIIRIAQQQ